MYLAGQSVTYRRQWALRVVSELIVAVGPRARRVIEIHAGASYVRACSSSRCCRRRESM